MQPPLIPYAIAHGDRRLRKGSSKLRTWQRVILATPRHCSASHQEAGGPSMRPNTNGVPAKPQYPLRCSA
jgi:hypothetical protein